MRRSSSSMTNAMLRYGLITTQWEDGLADGAGVWLVVDGEERGSRRYDAGPGAGSWGADSVLEPDRGHEITFRVRRGLTDQTELAVVLYELVR